MRTLLEEFWYGNVNPQEQSTENNREIKNLLNLMGKKPRQSFRYAHR